MKKSIAVLGLGNIGPYAAMPVMEGKAVLFKEFGDVNAVPICLDTQDTEEIIKALYEMGAEILAADRNEELVNEAAKYCTSSVCADLSNEENLQALGLKDMDIVVVAMAKNLEASIISVSVSKELEVPLIVAKSGSARMSSILEKIGADRVVIPEEYAGERWAKILISETILDFFEVDSSLCMIEMKPLEKWIGKSAKDLDLRQKNKINIAALLL